MLPFEWADGLLRMLPFEWADGLLRMLSKASSNGLFECFFEWPFFGIPIEVLVHNVNRKACPECQLKGSFRIPIEGSFRMPIESLDIMPIEMLVHNANQRA